MGCMRCGKKTEGKDVFCAECLAEMEQYPVKPDVIIQIPVRTESESRKPAKKKKELSPEEQLENAGKVIRALVICILVLLTGLILTGLLLFYTIGQTPAPAEELPMPEGRNYTITAPAED